ncbi:MAG: arginine deiminase [Spirochaetaceae bacterium]|nr:arginine deiminase [Spirochaetaceae bacterium]
MSINVKSEIGQLQKVLLHRPGVELEHLTPDYLVKLLFDDIPFLKVTQQEHDSFADLLTNNGVEVVYLEDMMANVIEDPTIKESFIRDFIASSGSIARAYKDVLFKYLMDIEDNKELVLRTMSGIKDYDLGGMVKHPLSKLVQQKTRFVTDPIPNLYFTRDPFASIGNGVSLNHMYSVTRKRETLYDKYVLLFHQSFGEKINFYYDPSLPYCIEGGDIFNFNNHILGVGLSQRTTPEACELLAKNIFEDEESTIDTILAFDIPNIRAFMHLDTVFTQADIDKFIIHPGIISTLRVFKLTKADKKPFKVEELDGKLEDILKETLKLDKVTLINCGGSDSVVAEREQWNDGSNVLCISPGRIITYDRNITTNQLLIDNGIKVLTIPSSELSRGRGGPRCMSMPLKRGDI